MLKKNIKNIAYRFIAEKKPLNKNFVNMYWNKSRFLDE